MIEEVVVRRERELASVGLAIVLIAPSTQLVSRFAGDAGASLYASLTIVAAAALPSLVDRLRGRLTDRQADGAAAFLIALLCVVIAVAYPILNTTVPGHGSDRDDALRLAATALLRRRYPYRELTYLGGVITPLPGALLLAAPFVLLGNVALQTVLWLGVLYAAARRLLESAVAAAVLLAWIVSTPAVLHELVTGGDLFANGIYVGVFALLLLKASSRPRSDIAAALMASAGLGVAIASRLTYPFLLPLAFVHVASLTGRARATIYVLAVCLVFAALTLPFYLHDPEQFPPLHMRYKVEYLSGFLLHAAVVVPVLTALFALLVCRLPSRGAVAFMIQSTLVIAFPTLLLAAFASMNASLSADEPLSYGVGFTGLAALGFGVKALGRPTRV